MAIRIGKIELLGVQNLNTEEARTLIEQRVPEQQGSAFLDLGREAITIVLDGVLLGADVLATLETLRQAQAKAEPQSFAADIVVGVDLTEVVIEDFRVRQIAGYADRYQFSMRLREYIETPTADSAGLAAVDDGIGQDANDWSQNSLDAASVLQDPGQLPAALAENPDLLNYVNMDDRGASLADKMDGLSANELGSLVQTVGELDPAKANQLFDAIGNAGKLGDMLTKFSAEGTSFIAFIKNIDPSVIGSLMKAFSGGLDFLEKLKKVGEQASKLAADIVGLELPPEIGKLVSKGNS